MRTRFSLWFALLGAITFPSFSVFGQSPVGIGQWRTHYAFENILHTEQANEKIYCANLYSLFYYDPEDLSFTIVSKKDGLSGVDISGLGSYDNEILLVGYTDGNIDFIENRSITQFNDIQRANILGSKSINQFYTQGNKVYICTDYGLSVLNMDRREIADSYLNVSSDGSDNPFHAVVLSADEDSIFVASSMGLLCAPYNPGVNLRNYNNWKVFSAVDGLPAGETKTVGRLGHVIYAGVEGSGIYYFNGTQWQSAGISGSTIRSIRSGETALIACVDGQIYKVTSEADHPSFSVPWMTSPYHAFINASGTIWYVNPGLGLASFSPDHTFIGQPNGPFAKDAYRLKYIKGYVVNCRGGLNVAYGNVYQESAIMLLGDDDVWKSYSIYDGIPSQTRDLLDAAYHPGSGKWYLPTFGWGLIIYDLPTKTGILMDTTNSPLKMQYLTAATTDEAGTVWVAAHAQVNRAQDYPFLHSIDASGTWHSYKATQTNGKYPQEIVIDQQSNKWIRLTASGGIRGLMMFKEVNPAAGTSTQVYFGTEENAGALPDINVNAIDVDKTGQVWVGTNQGICVFTNPSQIRPGNIPKAYFPIVNGFPLFFDKKINCIKTDAANRKWVGTPDGVFLLSADGLETIHKFDKTNSPLTDNNINTITINEKSGEVFIANDKGILSYRGDATFGEKTFNDVKVFPNPVTRDFDGWVGISGLANNSRVKITDIAGKLTYETPANGGTASWNLKDYTGRRATAGVYLIFCASDDGSEKFVGKIAVLE